MEVFQEAYRKNRWGSKESISGPGSTIRATELIRSALPDVLEKCGVRSIVDAPCGDFNWMKELSYTFERYIGIDVVPELIEETRVRYGNDTRYFQGGNIITDILPYADAVLCRDCLVHFSYRDVFNALHRFKLAGFKFVILTTFIGRENKDIPTGNWRPIDMTGYPFCLPEPTFLLRERPVNPDDQYNDKHLGVWAIDSIPEKFLD